MFDLRQNTAGEINDEKSSHNHCSSQIPRSSMNRSEVYRFALFLGLFFCGVRHFPPNKNIERNQCCSVIIVIFLVCQKYGCDVVEWTRGAGS